MNTFSKRDTLAVKGAAIMFMVFAHLFNNMSLCNLCSPLIYLGDDPLVYLLIYAMNPVQFFIFLSGYGLYIAYRNGKSNNRKRIFKLYVHYWITLAVFVSIGFVIGKQGYPGDMLNVFDNMIGWRNTYNHETWFLLPYVLLALASSVIFKFTDRYSPYVTFGIGFGIYLFMRLMSHYDGDWVKHYQAYRWLSSFFTLLFPFLLGMLTARCLNLSQAKNVLRSSVGGGNVLIITLLSFCVVSIILLRNYFHSLFYPFYVSLFVVLFVILPKPGYLKVVLEELGKRSTSIWLVHTYFCYYFFQDFIYGFKYPLLIYVVLMIISYVASVVVDYVNLTAKQLLGL